MPDYNNGKIYKIICNETNKIYIGSTVRQLNIRLSHHKSDYKRYDNGLSKSYFTSYIILSLNNYKIELIEKYPCNNKKELTSRESYYIREFDCVNKVIPDRTKKEYENLEYVKERRKINAKKYIQNNKEKIKLRKKRYHETHKFICECGGKINSNNSHMHLKTKKHQSYINGDWIFSIEI